MNLRRLYPETDELLLREAFYWDQGKPSWYLQMDQVFGPDDVDGFLAMLAEANDIIVGIFDAELIGLLVVAAAGKDTFNSHLWAKRGSDVKALTQGINQVVRDFLGMGMKEGFAFIAEKNLAVRQLCDNIGFRFEGVCMYRGTYKGKVIRWMKYSIRPEAQQMEMAA